MPHVEITIGAGRSGEQLRSMIHRVHTAVVETVGAQPDHVRIVVNEVARSHWATGDVTLQEMDQAAADVASDPEEQEQS